MLSFGFGSNLKRAGTKFFDPLHAVVFERSKHHGPVPRLHTKCWHVLLQTAHRVALRMYFNNTDTCKHYTPSERLTMGQASALGGSLRTLISSDSWTTFSFLSPWGWWCLLTPATCSPPAPAGQTMFKQTQDYDIKITNYKHIIFIYLNLKRKLYLLLLKTLNELPCPLDS